MRFSVIETLSSILKIGAPSECDDILIWIKNTGSKFFLTF